MWVTKKISDRRNKKNKPNTNNKLIKSLKTKIKNNDVIMTKADKENTVVILQRSI